MPVTPPWRAFLLLKAASDMASKASKEIRGWKDFKDLENENNGILRSSV